MHEGSWLPITKLVAGKRVVASQASRVEMGCLVLRLGIALFVLPLSLAAAALPTQAATAVKRSSGQARAHSTEAACQTFVQGFYDRYLKLTRGTHNGTPSDIEIKRRPAIFSRELRQRLAEDLAASSRNKDEVVGLDFDPFLNSQDVADRYVVRKVVRIGQRYRVEVHAVTEGKQTATPVVIPELVRSGSGWVFVNFHYRDPQNPSAKSDLLSILRQLRAGRRKNHH